MHEGRLRRPFTLVLAAGGARGFAHVGVLRALEERGLYPSALVGVSMGAVVAATYSLNPDWYRLLVAMDTSIFPGPRAAVVPPPSVPHAAGRVPQSEA